MMLNPITTEDLKHLPMGEKIARMDAFLSECYKSKPVKLPLVSDLRQTAVFQGHTNQTKVAWCYFDFLMQLEYVSLYCTFSNDLIYCSPLYMARGWNSEYIQLRYNALAQSIIVGSRIVFERFMDFIYFAFTEKQLRSRSKFSAYKNWLFALDLSDEKIWLIPMLIRVNSYNDRFRTPEVHDGSRLKSRLVCMAEPDGLIFNDTLTLYNDFSNQIFYLLALFDRKKASGYGGYGNIDCSWHEAYFNGDIEALQRYIRQWEKELKK